MRPRPLLPPLALVLLLLLLAAPQATAQDAAVLMQARTVAKLRQGRSTESPVVGRLDAGQQVKAGFAADNWLAVFPPDSPADDESARLGYVYAPLLAPADLAPEQPAAAAPARSPAPASPAPPPGPASAGPGAPYTVLAQHAVQRPTGPLHECAVLVSATTLPGPDELKALAAQVRADLAPSAPRVAVYLYLPGQSLEGPSYAVARLDADGLAEFWCRDTVLYGTAWAVPSR